MIRFAIRNVVALAIGFPFVVALTAQELPDEDSIPAAVQEDADFDELPSESNVPNLNFLAQAITLPAESEIPPDPIQQKPDELQEVVEEERDKPWLRLSLDGATAPLASVAFSADAQRIYAGGADKAVHVWTQHGNKWVYEKPVHWQVQRGPRGAILAVEATSDLLIFGGVAASTLKGQLSLFDARTLQFNRAFGDQSLRAATMGLATIPSSDLVAAIDAEGRVSVWELNPATKQWQRQQLRAGDFELFDESVAQNLVNWRFGGSAIAATKDAVFYPEPLPDSTGDVNPFHRLVRYNLKTSQRDILESKDGLAGTVTSIAASNDGKLVVAADYSDQGVIRYWNTDTDLVAKYFQAGGRIDCLDLSPSGNYLLVGALLGRRQSSLWLYQNQNGSFRQIEEWRYSDPVTACKFSEDETQLAFAVDRSVVVTSINRPAETTTLQTEVVQPARVAFSSANGYRVLLQTSADQQTDQGLVFETNDPQLLAAKVKEEEWIQSNPKTGNWKLVPVNSPDSSMEVDYVVQINGKDLCTLPLDETLDGAAVSACWIPDPENPDQPPLAIVVGTEGRNHIFVYQLDATGKCQLVRQFRGHSSGVTSVGVSSDVRYLVSGSRDGTTGFWKLENALDQPGDTTTLLNKWGANIEPVGDQLVVTDIVPDGPLYFRGVRKDDVVARMFVKNLLDQTDSLTEIPDQPDAILNQLVSADWRNEIKFEFQRNGIIRPAFFLQPAWQPLASLVVTPKREWAFWTPYGYYDASFNGHQTFGWQVNKGVNEAPDFFRAADLKNELEKPQLMEKLLTAGSVENALTSISQVVPNNLHERLAALYRMKPKIEIVSPPSDATIDGGYVNVEAVVELPNGIDIGKIKAFANGVPAPAASLVRTEEMGAEERDGFSRYHYSWRSPLPNEERVRIQILATTSDRSAAVANVDVRHELEAVKEPANVYLLSLGINDYVDGQIPKLDFAVNNATEWTRALVDQNRLVDQTDSTLITGNNVRTSTWRSTSAELLTRLQGTAKPDDWLVVFLSGHGYRDPGSKEYFFLTQSTRMRDLLGREYRDCISFDELGQFAEIPCRKLLILDTCHSGSLQALQQKNLKTVVRALENDLVFTITSSEGAQESFESKDRRLGYFTASLLDALNGVADTKLNGGNGDGKVVLSEVVRYLQSQVPKDAARLGIEQYPTASPSELIEFVQTPFATTDSRTGE